MLTRLSLRDTPPLARESASVGKGRTPYGERTSVVNVHQVRLSPTNHRKPSLSLEVAQEFRACEQNLHDPMTPWPQGRKPSPDGPDDRRRHLETLEYVRATYLDHSRSSRAGRADSSSFRPVGGPGPYSDPLNP